MRSLVVTVYVSHHPDCNHNNLLIVKCMYSTGVPLTNPLTNWRKSNLMVSVTSKFNRKISDYTNFPLRFLSLLSL